MSENGLDSGSDCLSIPEKQGWESNLKNQPNQLAVIDGTTVITGSFNWSPSAAHQNDETLMVIHSPELAAHFSREIDRMWRGAELGITARMRRKLERQQARCGSGEQRQ